MNLYRKCTGALLGPSLLSATVGAQSWTAVTAGTLNQAGGAGYWDQLSYDGSRCNIGYIIFGMRSPSCTNGGAGSGWWSGGTGPLVSSTASYVNPGASNHPIVSNPQFALFSTINRSPASFGGRLGYTVGDSYIIGYEDLGKGDFDYQDVVIRATAVVVPEPEALCLTAGGLIAVSMMVRRRKA